MIDEFLSLFTNPFLYGLLIALASAWFTSEFQAFRERVREHTQMLQKRIFFIRSCIFLIEQNFSWINDVSPCNFPIDTVLGQIRRIDLSEFPYQEPADKLVVRLLSMYEEALTTALASISFTDTKGDQDEFYIDNLKSQSQEVVNCLEICIKIYEDYLELPLGGYLFHSKPLTAEQAAIRERLKILAQEGHSSRFLPKNKSEL